MTLRSIGGSDLHPKSHPTQMEWEKAGFQEPFQETTTTTTDNGRVLVTQDAIQAVNKWEHWQ